MKNMIYVGIASSAATIIFGWVVPVLLVVGLFVMKGTE